MHQSQSRKTNKVQHHSDCSFQALCHLMGCKLLRPGECQKFNLLAACTAPASGLNQSHFPSGDAMNLHNRSCCLTAFLEYSSEAKPHLHHSSNSQVDTRVSIAEYVFQLVPYPRINKSSCASVIAKGHFS